MDSILEDRTVDLEELGEHLEKDEAITEDWFIASNELVEDIENVTDENDYRVGSVSKNKPSGIYLEVISFDYKFTFWIDGKGKIYYDEYQPEDKTKEDEDDYLFDSPGIFKMTINAGKPAQWLALIKFGEYVPEGARISYEFQTSNDRTNWSEKTNDIKELERSQYARVIVTMTANSKGESPKIKGLSMKFVTDEEIEEIEEENKTIIKLKDPIKAGDIAITEPIDITQGGMTNTHEIKIKPKEDGTYEMDTSSLPDGSHITPNIKVSKDGINWETIDSGNINNTYPYVSITYDNLTIPDATFSVKTPSISSKTVQIQTAQKVPEWITVSELDLYADATAIGEWLSIEPDEYLPTNTRLVYKFSKSNNFQNWTSWSDSITENGNSQYLWIKVYSQIEFRSVTERARLNDIIVNYKLNNEVKGTKAVVDGFPPNQAIIEIKGSPAYVGGGTTGTIKATVKVSDDKSGIDIGNCKYIINSTNSKIGTDPSNWSGAQTLKSTNSTIDISSSTVGDKYLHILSVNKVGMKIETISSRASFILDNVKPNDAVIDAAKYTVSSGTNINITMTVSDSQSGINLGDCKWKWSDSATLFGINSDTWSSAETFTQTTISTAKNANGWSGYLHILSVDKVGNKKETVSPQFTWVSAKNLISLGGSYSWNCPSGWTRTNSYVNNNLCTETGKNATLVSNGMYNLDGYNTIEFYGRFYSFQRRTMRCSH